MHGDDNFKVAYAKEAKNIWVFKKERNWYSNLGMVQIAPKHIGVVIL